MNCVNLKLTPLCEVYQYSNQNITQKPNTHIKVAQVQDKCEKWVHMSHIDSCKAKNGLQE